MTTPFPKPPIQVRGAFDAHSRCAHYHSPVDIIAIKMNCCGLYYACKDCHLELADHHIAVWPRTDWNQLAVLCGLCQAELSITDYLKSDSRCSSCNAAFNPNCRNHRHFYFET